MNKLMLIVVTTILCPLLTGCVYYEYGAYYYVSLEGVENITIEKTETPSLRYHYWGGEMPVLYALDNLEYRLEFSWVKNYRPTMIISIAGHAGFNLKLKPLTHPTTRCEPQYFTQDLEANQIGFYWITDKECRDKSYEDKRRIRLSILSETGGTFENINIPFILKKNGFYALKESL